MCFRRRRGGVRRLVLVMFEVGDWELEFLVTVCLLLLLERRGCWMLMLRELGSY